MIRAMHSSQTPPTPITTRHLRITGRVQGVGYRWSMAQQAQALGVSGWVRNRRDGSVEAVASGSAAAVQALIEWAQCGPMGARVDGVEAGVAEGGFVGFEQRETA
jgi:acylphosphatase